MKNAMKDGVIKTADLPKVKPAEAEVAKDKAEAKQQFAKADAKAEPDTTEHAADKPVAKRTRKPAKVTEATPEQIAEAQIGLQVRGY